MALQIRRGLDADRLTVTPLEGELIYVTDTGRIYVGDGTTAGGTFVGPSESDTFTELADDATPQLGANLDLNSNDIVGTGNIDTTGNITITGTIETSGLGANLDLNGNNIVGTGNIDIDGTITATGNVNIGDAGDDTVGVLAGFTTTLTPSVDSSVDIGTSTKRWRDGHFAGLTVTGQIDAIGMNGRLIADDSTISYDPSSNVFDGTRFIGDLIGDASGDHSGTFTGRIDATGILNGDVKGSVFGDDSSLIIDGQEKFFTGNIRTSRLVVDNPSQPGDGVNGGIGEVNIDVASNDNRSLLNLRRVSTGDLTGDTSLIYGTVTFGRRDINGQRSTATIFGRENAIFFGASPDGVFNTPEKFFVWRDYKLGVGVTTPAEVLDVGGNAKISGTVQAAGFIGSVFADDSATIVDGITGAVTAQSFVQFGSLTTAERDDLTAANGMVIYNSTDNKFQGYENGAWVNLV